jgi:molybdenum cofactor guanylyltransferase
MIARVTGVVLAGGNSTRMGQDKALLTRGGRSLIGRTCEVALACSERVWVVTPWPQRYQPWVPSTVHFLQESGRNEVQNETQNQRAPGPLVGFAQVWPQVETDWVLLLACDLPCLEVEVLQRWVAMLDESGGDAIAMLPISPQGLEPLCGFYHQRCRPSLEQALTQGIRSFQKWLTPERIICLSAPPGMLMNCNTPQEWDMFESFISL